VGHPLLLPDQSSISRVSNYVTLKENHSANFVTTQQSMLYFSHDHILHKATAMRLIIVVFLLFSCNLEKAKPEKQNEIGRYQLFQAKYNSFYIDKNGKVGSDDETKVFKIDTTTGKVEYYSPMVLGRSGSEDSWLPVGD
jgi:hypothetical protein